MAIFIPPMPAEDIVEAQGMMAEKARELAQQVHEATWAAISGFWEKPARERLAFYVSRGPAAVVDEVGVPVPGPWWAEKGGKHPKVVKRMEQDYATLLKRQEE